MKDIYAAIAERFIEQLKSGTVPWQKPWTGVRNIVSQKLYRGINSLLLGSAKFESPYWMTLKQASDLGGRIRKGARSLPVIYYNFAEKRDADGQIIYKDNGLPLQVPFLRWSNVFNLNQTEGIEPPKQDQTVYDSVPCDRAAAILASANICPVRHGGFKASYSPRKDEIWMPAPEVFKSREEYFHTLFHEATHSTGHVSRLNREGVMGGAWFGSQPYSKEELVAELGAAFLSNESGILDNVLFENSAAYLASWISALQNDHRLILSAASMAQRSTDFILGIQQKESVTENQIGPEHIGEQVAAKKEHVRSTVSARSISV